jgi:hypothetical protein
LGEKYSCAFVECCRRRVFIFVNRKRSTILPVSRFLAINIEGKIGQLTVRRTSSFTNDIGREIFVYYFKRFPQISFGQHHESSSGSDSQFFDYLLYAKSK